MLEKLAVVALAAASLSACVTQPTLADLDANRQRNAEASTASYTSFTAEQLRAAAYDVLKLLNPGEMHFDVRADSLLANEPWLFVVPLPQTGQRFYEVKFLKDGGDVRVHFAAQGIVNQLPVAPDVQEFRQDIDVGGDPYFWPNGKLFFSRLEYMLGRTNHWPTCKEAETAYGRTPEFMCGGFNGGIGILDKAPPPRS